MAIGRIPEPGTGIPESIVDAKGDLISATAADTPARLAVGANKTRLVADSAEATGLKFVADTTNSVVTTKGDLLAGTAADTIARLAVGATNGMLLTVDSNEATGLKYALPAASSSGLTLITQNTFSNVASVTIDSVFSATYRNYIAYINYFSATNADDFQMQFRFGSSTQTTNYYGAGGHINGSNVFAGFGYAAASQATLAANSGASNRKSSLQINFNEVGTGSSVNPNFFGTGFSNQGEQTNQFAGMPDATENFTGFLLKSSAANITGSFQVYGLAI